MLFMSPRGRCIGCHDGANLTDGGFHNIGVGYRSGSFADVGRFAITGVASDTGAFKTPSLRNVALTAPYFHDGTGATLRDVVHRYNLGGTPNPYQDSLVTPLGLTSQQEDYLVAFLESLTGAPPTITAPPLPE